MRLQLRGEALVTNEHMITSGGISSVEQTCTCLHSTELIGSMAAGCVAPFNLHGSLGDGGALGSSRSSWSLKCSDPDSIAPAATRGGAGVVGELHQGIGHC